MSRTSTPLMHRRLAALAVMIVGGLAAVGVTAAAVVADEGAQPISGCYNASSGELKVVASGATCKDTLIQWPSWDDFVATQTALASETRERVAADEAESAARAAADESLAQSVAEQAAQLSALATELESLQSRLGGVETAGTFLDMQVTGLAGALAPIPGQLTSLDGGLKEQSALFGVLRGTLNTELGTQATTASAIDEQLAAAVAALEAEAAAVEDDAQLAGVDLQNMLQKQQQTLQMMSNISKMIYDTNQAVIRKIGG